MAIDKESLGPGDAAQDIEPVGPDPAVHPEAVAMLEWLWAVYDALSASHRDLPPPPIARPDVPEPE